VLALLAPGQGAQVPGFLTPWLDVPGVADRLTWYSAVVGCDLVQLGTTGTAEEIRDTANCQPLLTAAALASAHALFRDGAPPPALVAGHSVGEFAAAAVAGALSEETALVVVRERGLAMAAACAAVPTGMTAVVGGEPDEVVAAIERASLTAATRNGAGQVVAAGPRERLESLPEALAGIAKAVPLQVAGAFHTRFMASAEVRLAALVAAVPVRDPAVPVLSNADGAVVTDGAELLRRLVRQVTTPVRWDACMETLAAYGVTAVVELLPGGTLTGLLRRAHGGIATLALKTPEQLGAARGLLTERADAAS
jgi:[acyl-carrier-protein] S-malonyltransferase